MECHIEQVLYRDQRTIKMRFFDSSKSSNANHQQTCLSYQNDHQTHNSSTEKQRSLPYLSTNLQDLTSFSNGSKFSNANCSFSIRGGASSSSLKKFCHIQYFSKFKRLTRRTDVKCGCMDNSYNMEISEKKRRNCPSWIKKLQNVLILSAYLSLLSFSNTHARSTKMNDQTPFWIHPCDSDWTHHYEPTGDPPKEMNITGIKPARVSAESALGFARDLKDRFRNHTNDTQGLNPETNYATVPNYSWLPNVPNDGNLQEYLTSLNWQEILLAMHKNLQIISVPYEQLLIDINGDATILYNQTGRLSKLDFEKMRGLIRGLLCEILENIAFNNLLIENVDRNIMPNDLRGNDNNISSRTIRDWITLRELVNILEYIKKVCEHFSPEGATEASVF